ncbi:SLATT domain-containing protein [Streptacidiphilus neutrinimicus]|uniref:SLATT domain-containing protein n=1 Tax=Streptacidiphilus neutrinimicus TaxID=105420 RepID=UPI001377AA9A|nr:SLATT domain-containing protein [Streptacidiphilus neutrinimicus]
MTTQDGQLEFVAGEVRRILTAIKRHQKGDRRRAFALQMATVTLSACSTVLLGVRVGDPGRQVLLDIALGISALVTVLAAWDAFFAHRSLWIQASQTVLRLESLDRDITFYSVGLTEGDGPEPAAVREFLDRLDGILREHHDAWAKLRKREDAS